MNRQRRLVLAWIRQLYAVETDLQARCAGEWRELPREEREDRIVAVRQDLSVPILRALHDWLDAESPKLTPKAAMRGAIDYLRNHWQALVRYTTDGKLAIDNGAAERALRGLTIGRRNWRAPDVARRYSGRSPPRDALLAMFERTVAV